MRKVLVMTRVIMRAKNGESVYDTVYFVLSYHRLFLIPISEFLLSMSFISIFYTQIVSQRDSLEQMKTEEKLQRLIMR